MNNNEWKKVCAACADGTPPKRCAYYGDPNGCNAPTLGKHPEGNLAERLQEALEKAEHRIAELERAPGNAAALREALRECRDELYEIQGMSELDDTRIALLRQKSNAALGAPARNVDRFATANDAVEGYIAAHPHDDEPDASTYGSWLFAPAKEGKEARRG